MSPWLRRAAIGLTIGAAAVIVTLPQAVRFLLFRNGLPFQVRERFGVTGTVSDLGWRTLTLGALTWGPPGEETIAIESVIIDYTLSGLLNKTLDSITVSGLTIHVSRGDDGLRLRGIPQTPPSLTQTPNSGYWNMPIPLNQLDVHSARILIHDQTTTDIPFQLRLNRHKEQPHQVIISSEILTSTPAPSVNGVLDLAARTLHAEFSGPFNSLAKFLPEFAMPQATIAGRCELGLKQQDRWTLAIDATISHLTQGNDITLSLPSGKKLVSRPVHLQVQGEGQGTEGTITLSAAVDRLVAPPVSLLHINISLPWSNRTTSPPAETSGTISIASISVADQKIGSLAVTLLQTARAAGKISGTFTGSENFPLHAKVNASASLDSETKKHQFKAALVIPPFDLKAFDWQTLITLIQLPPNDIPAFDLAGLVNASITARGDNDSHEAKANLSITGGALTIPTEKIEISGVSGTMLLPNLLTERTRLRGEITVRNTEIAEIHLTDGEMKFYEDEKGNLTVERLKAGWSGGTIQAKGLSFRKGSSDMTGDLYCDTLDLAQLLSQLGIPQVSGKGAITGRIPLKYSDGKVEIHQGLLTSNPGGGSLRFAASDLITGGVPPGSPQFGQLQFAAAALEDFTYTRLSMGLESRGDEMTIAMSVDGHPAKPLPFRYDARQGTFTKIVGSGEIGINQPVKLDVNFRLPFNELLGYGKSIKNVRDQLR